jgi:excinuclease ABC subunit C
MSDLTKHLPDSPGVYIFKNENGKVLYIGKAGNIKKRVESYFHRSKDIKIKNLLDQIRKIDYKKTDTAIEALILESKLIKHFKPPYNIREKDDKSFLYVEITKDKVPRVILVRGRDKKEGRRYGPFTSASSIREAMRIIRRIFPYNVHQPSRIATLKRPCFDNQIGLCPGTCTEVADAKDIKRNLRHIRLFLEGNKKQVLRLLKHEMGVEAERLNFEIAAKIKRQIFALQHIQDIAVITKDNLGNTVGTSQRIEGYDVSNISGNLAVGSMAVFINSKPDVEEYRKFKIRTLKKPNDVGMLREILERRFSNDWPIPDLVLIDGGRAQVNVALDVIGEFGLKLPVVGIAKGKARKKNEFIGRIPEKVSRNVLIQLRDEAHRFAINYHRKLIRKQFV